MVGEFAMANVHTVHRAAAIDPSTRASVLGPTGFGR
jgi:hypothetical protein